jgi:hypothetical protein
MMNLVSSVKNVNQTHTVVINSKGTNRSTSKASMATFTEKILCSQSLNLPSSLSVFLGTKVTNRLPGNPSKHGLAPVDTVDDPYNGRPIV